MFWRVWGLWIELCELVFVLAFLRWANGGSVHLDYDSTNPPGHLR